MANEVQVLDANDIKDVSDSELLAAAEEIVNAEIKKSQNGLEGNKEDEKLGKTQGDMPESGQGSKGEAPQEANPKNKKKDGDMSMNKSQADIEGHETGGLAPSVQGNIHPEVNNGVKPGGDAQDEANNEPHNPHGESNGAEPNEEPAKNKNKPKGPTQDGDSQDEANKDSMAAGKDSGGNGVPAGGEGGGHPTQLGDSQNEANPNSKAPMKKSQTVAELFEIVKSINSRLKTLEKAINKDPIQKSAIHADVLEKLSKSYITQIESGKKEKEDLEKSFNDKFDKLQKSYDEMKTALSKPARTRESVSNLQAIEKGSANSPKKIYKSKAHMLEKMEDLRKSGKITGDDIISFNASGHLTDSAKKALFEE